LRNIAHNIRCCYKQLGFVLCLIAGLFGQSLYAFDPVIQTEFLDGNDGFRLDGVHQYQGFGHSVSSAGDFNGDGFDDLIIGAPDTDLYALGITYERIGAFYVVYGSDQGFESSSLISDLDGTNGFRIEGNSAGEKLGESVSYAGDLNDDGFDDIIVGAPGTSPNGSRSGTSYVVFGRAEPFRAQMYLAELSSGVGFHIEGEAEGDFSGGAVSSGDINNDGIDDVIIGAVGAGNSGGSVYVLFGKNTKTDSLFNAYTQLSDLDGNNGFRIEGAFGEDLGRSVSGDIDINGDGIDDIVISARVTTSAGVPGGAYVIFGGNDPFPPTMETADIDGSNGFRMAGVSHGDTTGFSLSRAGDINADGIGDLIIGAQLADNGSENSGSSYVVFGSTSQFPQTLELANLTGRNGFRIDGAAHSDFSGDAVSDAGDVNGDGIDDLIVGAFGVDEDNDSSGAAYVIFGSRFGFASTLNLSRLNGVNGFRLEGKGWNRALYFGDRLGEAVGSAGDINGDGIDDFMVSGTAADYNALYGSGSVYIVYGSSAPPPDDSICFPITSKTGAVTMICL